MKKTIALGIMLLVTLCLAGIAQAAVVSHPAEQIKPGAFGANHSPGGFTFPNSNVGIGVSNPTAQLSIGNEGSGEAGQVNGTQLLLGGSYNQGVNTGTSYKLRIEAYDNDGSIIYPIYLKDENQYVDFYIRNSPSASSVPRMYFKGNIGIATESPSAKLEIAGTGSSPLQKLSGVSLSSFAGNDLVIRNLSALRFSDSANWWSNDWAGIRYILDSRKLVIGGPASSYFSANSDPQNVTIIFDGIDAVGIGTDSPSSTLDVAGNISASGNAGIAGTITATSFKGDGSQLTNIPGTGIWSNNTGNATYTGGNVGIGTTSPKAKLHVQGNMNISTDASIGRNLNVSGSAGIAGTVTASSFKGDGSQLTNVQGVGLWTNSSGSVTYTSGKVGIGTTSPDRPLTVQGTGANSELVSFRNTSGSASWHINNLGNGLNFAESLVADGRLYIKKGGKVGIGTTDPQVTLHIRTGTDVDLVNGGGFFMMGNHEGEHIAMDSNEIMAKNNASISTLYFQNQGGATQFGGDITVKGSIHGDANGNVIIRLG